MKGSAAVLTTRRRGERHNHQTRSSSFPRLLHFAVEYLLVVPVAALAALVWANASPESYYRFAHAANFLINDVAMVFFFALVTKEIVEARAPGGILHSWRATVVPVVAAAGASAAGAVLYLAAFSVVDAPMLARAWPVTLAVDLAAVFFVGRVVFGQHPAVPFLLLLGIAVNGAGFIVLALQAPIAGGDVQDAALILAVAIATASALRKHRVNSFWPYVTVSGPLFWWALFRAGLHPAFALVPVMLFLPRAAHDRGFFVDAPPNAHDTLNRFERWCRLPAQAALFLFALVNAGVPLQWVEAGVWALPVAMIIARPAGVIAGVALAAAAGFHLPRPLGWRELVVVGMASGIGFTMALFFATAVFAPGQALSETKVAALLSVVVGAAAIGTARLLRVGRFAK